MPFIDLNFIFGAGGFILGVVSLLYALHQGSEKKKLERIVRSQNWHTYSKLNNANGQLQGSIRLYRERHQDRIDPDVLANFEKADAWAQDIFRELVRQIQFSEKLFDKNIIDAWVADGKISEIHANALFKVLIV